MIRILFKKLDLSTTVLHPVARQSVLEEVEAGGEMIYVDVETSLLFSDNNDNRCGLKAALSVGDKHLLRL